MKLRTYKLWLDGSEDTPRVVHHVSAAKAKYEYLLDIGDLFPDGLPWTLVRCKALGPFRPSQHRDERLEQLAAQRGRPDIELGGNVTNRWNDKPGVIVGADNGDIMVMFEDDEHPSRCHPGDIVTLKQRLDAGQRRAAEVLEARSA